MQDEEFSSILDEKIANLIEGYDKRVLISKEENNVLKDEITELKQEIKDLKTEIRFCDEKIDLVKECNNTTVNNNKNNYNVDNGAKINFLVNMNKNNTAFGRESTECIYGENKDDFKYMKKLIKNNGNINTKKSIFKFNIQ